MNHRAKALITLEVDVPSAWGKECTMDQVYKQAKQDAIGLINKIMKNATDNKNYLVAKAVTKDIKIINVVTYEDESK